MTVRIGLTGPIGCGKSTVAGWLAELGAVVVDADVVARTVTDQPHVADAIAMRFGAGVRRADGSIDRGGLARRVFGDPAALADLERIVHPAVRPPILAAMDAARREGAPAVVVEAIKLVEGGLAELCDEVWVVTCDPGEQRARIMDRGADADDADRRIAAQAGLVERVRPLATRQIDTSGPRSSARRRVERAWIEANAAS